MAEQLGSTPSQTVGPYLDIGLSGPVWEDGMFLIAPGTPGAVVLTGTLRDGQGDPVGDGLIEVWQADPDGRFPHPDDPRGAARYEGFRGFGRCATDAAGRYAFTTLRPGRLPDGAGGWEAPHLDVLVFARGLLHRLVTRVYVTEDAAALAADPVLSGVDAEQRRRLTAQPQPDGTLRFDICLQGGDETPFFEV